MELLKQFDTYSLKARVFPAIIAGLPTLALLFIIVPWDHLGISQAVAALMGFILVFAFADMARHRGKNIQVKLGSGETPEQWHRKNSDISETSKNIFRPYMAIQLKHDAPTATEESFEPTKANDFYRAANAWLRERTRDTQKFSMLFGENITYGFRRNLLGLKYIAITCNILVLAFSLGVLYYPHAYFLTLPRLDEKLVIIMAAVFLHTVYMIFAVNKKAVLEASRAYGRQLILSCETLMNSPPPAQKN
nr:hypothetical protein [uncultured Pseudomonas sp.]